MVTRRKEPCQAYMLHYLMFRLSRGQLIFMCWSTFACTEHVLRMAFIENWRARRFYSWCDWSCAPRHDFRAPSSCKAPWKAQHMEKRQPWNPKWSCSSSGSWDKPSESLRDPLPDLQIRSGLSAMLPHPACPQLHPPPTSILALTTTAMMCFGCGGEEGWGGCLSHSLDWKLLDRLFFSVFLPPDPQLSDGR